MSLLLLKSKLKKDNISLAQFIIKGYCLYTNDFQNCSRGVLIYVRNTIKSKQLYHEKPLQEVVTVGIEGQKDTLTISNIYRSPNSPEDNNKCLNNFIDNLATKTSSEGTDEPHLLDLIITNDSLIDCIELMAPVTIVY